MRHVSFIARTVFVQKNDVEAACKVLNRILGQEDILEQYRRTRFYEKPFQFRRRINFERCKSIYNEDMDRKIQFVLRKNRVDPFPGFMDPWLMTQAAVTAENLQKSTVIANNLTFEDNFNDKLPDSDEYIAILEEKLRKLKSDPNILRELAEKRESCMQQLLYGSVEFKDEQILFETPVNNSAIVRSILPQKQALTQGEVVELVKYDQLIQEDSVEEEN